MNIQLHPLGARVIVRLKPLPEKTGHIFRVDRNEYARHADVISVGPKVRDVWPGQVVLVTTLAGQDVNGVLIVPESSILGVVDAEDTY